MEVYRDREQEILGWKHNLDSLALKNQSVTVEAWLPERIGKMATGSFVCTIENCPSLRKVKSDRDTTRVYGSMAIKNNCDNLNLLENIEITGDLVLEFGYQRNTQLDMRNVTVCGTLTISQSPISESCYDEILWMQIAGTKLVLRKVTFLGMDVSVGSCNLRAKTMLLAPYVSDTVKTSQEEVLTLN